MPLLLQRRFNMTHDVNVPISVCFSNSSYFSWDAITCDEECEFVKFERTLSVTLLNDIARNSALLGEGEKDKDCNSDFCLRAEF